MRLNTTSFGLLLASSTIPIMPVKSQDGIKNADLGASDDDVVDFMRHAQAVYVFSVAAGCAKRPNERDLRLLEAEARQGLVGTLCNSDNWNWVTGGAPCEMRDVGVLFRKDKDELILCFCSMHDMGPRPSRGLSRRRHFWPENRLGLAEGASVGNLEAEVCASGNAQVRSN